MKKIKHCVLFLLLMTILPSLSQGQIKQKWNNYKDKRQVKKSQQISYLVLETGLTYSNNQDLSTSNQIYNGAGLGLSIGEFKETPNVIKDYEAIGLVNNFISSQGGVTGFDWTVTTNYGHLFILNKDVEKDWRIAVGPKLDFLTQVRFIPSLGNSSIHWDGMLSLGAAARVDRTIRLPLIKKDVGFYGEAHLPLVGYLNRPNYAIPGWDVEHTFGYLGRMNRLETEFGIITPIRKDNLNLFRISYNWDVFNYRDNDVYKVVTGHHALSFALLVRLR
jgi:hypothetical protein